MQAIGYTRISTKDQSEYSLDSQHRMIADYCKRHSLTLLNTFTDDGESSYTFDRPDFKALEKFIKQNKAKYLVVSDHDRFSRNLAEALTKIKELQTKFGIQVVATTDQFGADFTDPSQFMMRAFKLMMAESELHRIRQRTKQGILQAKLNGRAVNKAPYGYINAKDSGNKPTLKIDEDKALVVRKVFSEFITGTPIEMIRKTVVPLGYKQTGQSAIQRILTNPLYAGMVRVPAYADHPEQLIDAVHPAIIPKGQFWTAQELLNDNKRKNYHANEEVPLKGVLRCPECGAVMSAGNSKGKKKYYWYYLCSVHRKNFSAKKLEQQLNEILDLLSFSDKSINWLIKKLTERINEHLNRRGHNLAEATKALRVVMQKIGNIEERYLEGGTSKESYTKVVNKHRIEQEELQRRIYELNLHGEQYFSRLNDLLPKLHDLRGAYEDMRLTSKHQFIKLVFGGFLIPTRTGFRTPFIEPSFAHNLLTLKEKGLLEVNPKSIKKGSEEPVYRVRDSNPYHHRERVVS